MRGPAAGNLLTPAQEARVEYASFPFYPDCLQLADLLVRDAEHALAHAEVQSA